MLLLWRFKLISILNLACIQLVKYFVFCNHELWRGEQLLSAPLCSSWQGFCLQCFFGIRVFVLPLKSEAGAAVQGCGEEPRLFVWGWEALGGQFCASTAQWLWNVLLSDNCIRTFPFSSLLNKKLLVSGSLWHTGLLSVCGFMLVLTGTLFIAVWF